MNNEINYSTLARYLKGETSETENRWIECWLDSDINNKKLLQQLKVIWHTKTQSERLMPNKSEAWKKLEQKTDLFQVQGRKSKLNKQFFYYAAAAVAAIIVIFGSFFLKDNTKKVVVSASLQTVVNNNKSPLEVVLSDSSHVWLRNKASIKFPKVFIANSRTVQLSGEAYFEVSHNPLKPFTVITETGTVKVLGTSFNINPMPNGKTLVNVFTGKVCCKLLNDTLKSIYVSGGEKGIIDNANNLLEKDETNDPNARAWKTGKLVFDNMSLDKVCLELSKYYDTTVLCSHEIDTLSLSVAFNNSNISNTLKVIELTLDLKAVPESGKIVLTKK